MGEVELEREKKKSHTLKANMPILNPKGSLQQTKKITSLAYTHILFQNSDENIYFLSQIHVETKVTLRVSNDLNRHKAVLFTNNIFLMGGDDALRHWTRRSHTVMAE